MKKEQLKSSSYMKSLYDDNKDPFDYTSANSELDVENVEQMS